jgi:hypothetical protein
MYGCGETVYVRTYANTENEIRRIVHCEWSTAHRPCQYTVVVQFIAKKSGDTEASDEDNFVSYLINDELYMCITIMESLI